MTDNKRFDPAVLSKDGKKHSDPDDISCWEDFIKKPVKIQAIRMHKPFSVKTKEGIMKGKKGDWLIRGIEGEFYPCNPRIFRKTYKKVEPQSGIPRIPRPIYEREIKLGRYTWKYSYEF